MMSITTRIASLASALALALGGTVLLTAPANAADIDPAPINTIIGSNVDLWAGEGLAVATDGTIYVSRWTQGDVLVYAPGATANALPEFVITGLIYPTGVALDPAGNLWVAERNVRRSGDGAIVEFAVGADGSATPLRDIEGLTTTLNDPTGITFDSAGNLYVAENPTVGAAILEFPKDATGDVPPLRTITGPLTFLSLPGGAPFGIAIASDGSIVVSTAVSGASAIAVFAPGAEGNVAPQRTITGSATQLDNNRALVLDAAGRIYASNLEDESAGSGSQTIYAANASGNAAPIERLTGATTGMNNVYYIALDAHGNLWVVNNGATKSGPSSITEYAALPAVTHISQSTGSPAGGESVTLSGVYFSADARVTFGGVPATSVVVNSSTSITAVVPAHAAGKVDVVVSQDNGTSSTTVAGGYTFAATLPTTGVDSWPLLGGGLLLGLVGGLLLIARRGARGATRD